MNPFPLESLRGTNTLPGTGNLDEDPIALDPGLLIHADQLARLCQRSVDIETQRRVNLRGNAARYDLQDFTAKVDQQSVHELVSAGCPITGKVHGEVHGFIYQVL